MHYRADVDGLRAVAVLAVILYHLRISGFFGGGYIGVDVFFVISGYLITSIIYNEMQGSDFSFLQFYERRVRRILPPLIALSVVFALFFTIFNRLFPPYITLDFFKSTFFMSILSANFYFLSDSGYFAAPSLTKPMLHTWSLAVEEQFYLIFPLILFLIRKKPLKKIITILAVITAVSFILNAHFIYHYREAVFYMLPTRAWELLAGSLLALGVKKGASLKTSNIIGFCGILLIISGIYLLTNQKYFPGFGALMPVCGSVMLIHSGLNSSSVMARILSLQPLVYIGKLSYSLYLWHWPIIVVVKYFVTKPGIISTVAILILTAILSVLSYTFIETPVRRRHVLTDRQKLFTFFGVAVAVMLLFTGSFSVIMSQRPEVVRYYAQKSNDGAIIPPMRGRDKYFYPLGIQGEPDFMIIGDSHASMFIDLLDRMSKQYGRSGISISYYTTMVGDDNTEYVQYKEQFMRNGGLKDVFIIQRWALYTQANTEFENPLIPKGVNNMGMTYSEYMKWGVENTIKLIKANNPGVRIWVILPVPEQTFDVPGNLYLGKPTKTTYAFYLERQAETIPALRSLEGVTLLDPTSVLCDAQYCYAAFGDEALYYDDDHLSITGTEYLKDMFDKVLRN